MKMELEESKELDYATLTKPRRGTGKKNQEK
jgi:hypothetical protein